MPRRAAFCPRLSDRLEERVVLSGARSAIVETFAVNMRVPKIGAMGDSLTDEYRTSGSNRSQAKNWVEILAATRHSRFGAYSAASRGEPRNAGYANNWARTDATSDDMVRNQLPGLTNQVRRGQVNLVWIGIGTNDLLHYVTSISPIAPPNVADVSAGLSKIEARMEDNLTTAVRTLMAANPNVRMTLANLQDLSTLPAIANMNANPVLKPLLNTLGPIVAKYNARIATLAAEQPSQIAVVDLNGLSKAIQTQAAANGKITTGGQVIDARTPGNDPTHLYLADGLHIGTVGQGLIANQFIQTIDTAFKAGVTPLRPAEILRQAKIR